MDLWRRVVILPWGGAALAALLILAVEVYLHTDDFLLRYRGVFAAGRAMDKVTSVERYRPDYLLLGNSRVDNGFDPTVLARSLDARGKIRVFNLGIPGINASVLEDIVERLQVSGAIGRGGARRVVIGLDETMLQAEDSLGYSVFFSDPIESLLSGELRTALAASVRLWGFSSNLKGLREPGTLERFLAATVGDLEPWGGPAAQNLGYRAGEAQALQDREQLRRQDASTRSPPSPAVLAGLRRLLDRLQAIKVEVAVVYPPLLNRDVLFLAEGVPDAAPYLAISRELASRGIAQIRLGEPGDRDPADFANAGHLNRRGAGHYSTLLAAELGRLWPERLASAP
jgi:hypothetical protein